MPAVGSWSLAAAAAPGEELRALLGHPLILGFGALLAAWLASRTVHEQVRRLGLERTGPDGRPLFAWTALFSALSDSRYRRFSESYRTRFGNSPYRIATLGYDSVLLVLRVAGESWQPGTPFPTGQLTSRGGFLGLDGAFRFQSDGNAQRALEVREVRDGQVIVVSPAPDSF